MLSPDHHTRTTIVAGHHAELRSRAAVHLTLTASAELRPYESRRLRLHRRLALVHRAAHAA